MAMPDMTSTEPVASSQALPSMHRAFFAAAGEPMIVLGEDLDVIECNEAAERLFGMPHGEFTAADFLDSVDLPEKAGVELLMRDSVTGTSRVDDFRALLRRLDGHVFPARISLAPFTADGRRLLALVVADRSLVERTQLRLRKEQELFRALFTNAPVPLREEDFSQVGEWFESLRAQGVTDLDRYIDDHQEEFVEAIMSIRPVRVNPAFVRLMKADTEGDLLVGFQSSEFSRGTLESFRHQFQIYWNGGDYHEAEFIGYNRLGEPFECIVTVSVQRVDGRLDLSRVVAAFLDLTEIRANQRSLERLISDKDQFIASVSHELRTPLASVLGLSEELHNNWDQFDIGEVRQLLGIIANQSADLASLVEDLLVAAKVEMGSLSVDPSPVSLATLVHEAIGEVAASGSLERAVDVHGDAGTAYADPVRVRQVIRNLVTNAIRYGGDSIWVEMGRDERPYVKVLDDGNGIPEDERDRVFDPYHRASGPDARLGALGLGLTISRQLARIMDGDLNYTYDGDKSSFTLTLPPARRS